MKLKILTTVCIYIFFTTVTLGQRSVISLSFTGISSEQYARLSKVEIRNLNKNCDTTLYWPDTVLSINTLGISDLHSFADELQLFQNIPNPVRENTKVLLYLSENGRVTIDVSLMSGKRVALFSRELQRGFHSFLFTPGSVDIYILTAFSKVMKKSIKVVSSMKQPSSECILKYIGAEYEPVPFKLANLTGEFTFSFGDTLRFLGYKDTLATAFQDAPSVNKFYTLNFPTTGISCPEMPSITYMGQTYNTVQIGTQCWLRENLNAGTKVNGSEEQTDNGIIEKYCYENEISNCNTYGGLYQWHEIMKYNTTPGSQGICPTNWHIPTFEEWDSLKIYLGVFGAGGRMKTTGTIETGTGLWNTPNEGATNESGFSALPAGYHYRNGVFYSIGSYSAFWSSTESYPGFAWLHYIYNDSDDINYWGVNMVDAYAVRCVWNN